MNAALNVVSNRIAHLVTEFVNSRKGQTFHESDLVQAVQSAGIQVSPSSPTRIMRALKKNGHINYSLLNRSKSLYQAI